MDKRTPSRLVYQLLNNRPKLKSDVLRKLKLLRLEDSEWYPECVKYYSTLDVKDRVVVDIGCDFGTSPMYFLKNGATLVWGYSLDEKYFDNDERYVHITGLENYPKNKMSFAYHRVEEIEGRVSVKLIQVPASEVVLKCDAEGWEWNLSIDFINSFHDWIIALHYPILNPFLYEWIKQNGEFVGSPSDSTKDGDEFAIFKKRGVNDA